MGKYRCLIFDLDDTLLDTSALLIGPAITAACQRMIAEGLKGNVSDCVSAYHSFTRENVRQDFFSFVVPSLGVRSPDADSLKIAQAGRLCFLQPKLPDQLAPIKGAYQLLEKLSNKYKLCLVTSGDRQTQKTKVERLGIAHFFEGIIFIDPLSGEKKYDAFSKIKQTFQLNPSEILCIGNRLDSEIKAANKLTVDTCFVRFGEHRHQQPLNDIERPTYIVDHILQIIETCQL